MIAADRRYPGQPPRPAGWIPHPTTPARSWAEVAETLQSGFAVVDSSWRLAYVADRFLSAAGEPDQLVGSHLQDLMPHLEEDDPQQLMAELLEGRRVDFEQYLRLATGGRHWYRVTVVPTPSLGGDLVAMVFTTDITTTSNTLRQLRDATIGLTEVETALRRRLSRDVHDGPIQLLAALVLQLGLSDTVQARDLERSASEAAQTLRNVIESYSTDLEIPDAALLQQWLAPTLAVSGSTLDVDDERSAPSGLLELQAIFVLICQVLRAASAPANPRTLGIAISDEREGERVVLTLLSTRRTPIAGRVAAQLGALVHHARAIGGTLTTWLGDDDVRTFSMWIPKQEKAIDLPVDVRAMSSHGPRIRTFNDLSALPPLSESAWAEILDEAPERIVEIDGDGRVTFTNAAFNALVGTTTERMVGASSEAMFTLGTVPDAESVLDRLDSGQFIKTHWYRESSKGDTRLIDLTMSPRLGHGGRWDGFLVTTADRTDVVLLQGIHATALADLALARDQAVGTSMHHLDEPLAACESLVELINQYADTSADPVTFQTIGTELERALGAIKVATDTLANSSFTLHEFGLALIESLAPLLDEFELIVRDDTDAPPSTEVSDALFRIAREALTNAVLHGRADSTTIELTADAHGTSCTIHDNGIGVDPDQLRPRPGHLGTRTMRERANERGGTCTIEPHPTIGTVVSVWLPYDADRVTQPDHQ